MTHRPGLLQHGMERGIEKRDIFLYDADREHFMQESSRSILDKGREREVGLGEAGAIRNVAGLSQEPIHPHSVLGAKLTIQQRH